MTMQVSLNWEGGRGACQALTYFDCISGFQFGSQILVSYYYYHLKSD